jgi:trans-2,3-dihydro-3-hydroxyanthranilate isomerase
MYPPPYPPLLDGGPSVPVAIVNACLRDGHGGSPTAVMWDAGLAPEACRHVPHLTGASHVVLLADHDPPIQRARAGTVTSDQDVAVRFFTSDDELPGCGHGTVAALAFLAEVSERAIYEVTLHGRTRRFAGRAVKAGTAVTADFDPGPVTVRPATPEERELAVDSLKLRAEIRSGEVSVASSGRPRLLVPLTNETALRELAPDLTRLRVGCDRLGLLGCYVYTTPNPAGRVAARMFAPSIGVPEDIANANSAACLMAKLSGDRLSQITVDMGDSLDRPATILAAVDSAGSGRRIRVGGSAAIVRRLEIPLAALGA